MKPLCDSFDEIFWSAFPFIMCFKRILYLVTGFSYNKHRKLEKLGNYSFSRIKVLHGGTFLSENFWLCYLPEFAALFSEICMSWPQLCIRYCFSLVGEQSPEDVLFSLVVFRITRVCITLHMARCSPLVHMVLSGANTQSFGYNHLSSSVLHAWTLDTPRVSVKLSQGWHGMLLLRLLLDDLSIILRFFTQCPGIFSLFSWFIQSPTWLSYWLRGKESACQYRRREFDPWVRKIPCRREWQFPLVFLPRESCGQRSLAGCRRWGCKESDRT